MSHVARRMLQNDVVFMPSIKKSINGLGVIDATALVPYRLTQQRVPKMSRANRAVRERKSSARCLREAATCSLILTISSKRQRQSLPPLFIPLTFCTWPLLQFRCTFEMYNGDAPARAVRMAVDLSLLSIRSRRSNAKVQITFPRERSPPENGARMALRGIPALVVTEQFSFLPALPRDQLIDISHVTKSSLFSLERRRRRARA